MELSISIVELDFSILIAIEIRVCKKLKMHDDLIRTCQERTLILPIRPCYGVRRKGSLENDLRT